MFLFDCKKPRLLSPILLCQSNDEGSFDNAKEWMMVGQLFKEKRVVEDKTILSDAQKN